MKIFRKKELLIPLVLALAGTAILFFALPAPSSIRHDRTITIGGVSVAVEVADNAQERSQGLSGRATLHDGEGMLFLLDEPSVPRFWMPDMRFPIDIVWISTQQEVVGIDAYLPPLDNINAPVHYSPEVPAGMVLEVPAGYAERAGIDVGDAIAP